MKRSYSSTPAVGVVSPPESDRGTPIKSRFASPRRGDQTR